MSEWFLLGTERDLGHNPTAGSAAAHLACRATSKWRSIFCFSPSTAAAVMMLSCLQNAASLSAAARSFVIYCRQPMSEEIAGWRSPFPRFPSPLRRVNPAASQPGR